MRDDGDRMTPPSATDRPERDNPGVLESLPSTRPQRPSARRAKARAKRGTTTPTEPPTNARPRRAAKATPKPVETQRAARAAPKAAEPPVPPQGFEAEEQIEPGRAVQPPSNTELAASVAELIGELAQAGLSTGERLVKDALRRLSG